MLKGLFNPSSAKMSRQIRVIISGMSRKDDLGEKMESENCFSRSEKLLINNN